jgi:hypothetical protein
MHLKNRLTCTQKTYTTEKKGCPLCTHKIIIHQRKRKRNPRSWFGLRKRSEPTGKLRKIQEIDGDRSSISGQEIIGSFRQLLVVSHGKEQEFDPKTPEESENFPARNSPEPTVFFRTVPHGKKTIEEWMKDGCIYIYI